MAEFNIPKIRFKWKGAWVGTTAYNKDDVVFYGGSSYVSEEPHTSTIFEADITASKWTKITNGRQWKDAWQPATFYKLNDVVLKNGAAYICIDPHTSSSAFESNITDWQIFVSSDGWESDWQPNTEYAPNALVRYNGIVYRCIATHQSNSTINGLEADQSKWEIAYEGVEYVGDWQEDTRYRVNDIVRYGSNLWRCIIGHTSNDDSTINFNDGFWQLEVPGFQFQGEWNISTVYVAGDVVRYGGHLYTLVTSTASGIAPTSAQSPDWILINKNYNFRGEWSAAQTYRPGDVVRRGGNLYASTVDQAPSKNAGSLVYTVTVGDPQNSQTGGKFYINNEYRPALNLEIGWTYIFDQSDASNKYYPNPEGGLIYNPHPFLFSSDNFNGILGGGSLYETNVVYKVDGISVDRPGYISALGTNVNNSFTVEITITSSTPTTLYYHTLPELNYGGVLQTVASNSGGDPNIDASWTLLTDSYRFRNFYQTGSNYAKGDVVTYKGDTWACIYPHVSNSLYNFPGNGNGINYWEILTEGDSENGLTQLGDLVTIGVEQDGSSIGPIEVPIGNPEEVLMVGPDQNLFYKKWGIVPKVYYVAVEGIDNPERGTTLNEPWKTIKYATENIVGPATIFVKTGLYRETLPIIIPSNVAVVGDELRSTRVEPAKAVAALSNDVTYTIAVLNRIKNIVGDILRGDLVIKTVGNTENQVTTIAPASGSSESSIVLLIEDIVDYLNYHLNSIGTEPTLVGSNTAITDEGFVNATIALTANTEFLAAEAVAYTQLNYPSYSFDPELCKRDIRTYINAWKYDIIYTGNYKSLLAARYYRNAVLGCETEDMFYMRDSSGLRNMTLAGLNGTLSPNNTQLIDQRPTAGAFVSLDPGWGPNDERVWISARSPYVQNVTTFGVGCVGQKVDGSLHNGGNRSIVSNDFTQVLSDGIGAWITNNGRVELVSVFTYYNHIGYLAENGGKIRATNGNNSYGNYGSVAVGFDNTEVPLSGKVDNRNQEAVVAAAFAGEANDELLVFEFSNAGEEYTTATYSIVSSGIGAATLADEFRDDGVFNVRLVNPLDSSIYTAGGGGYTLAGNNAQSGDTLTITLASNDQSLAAEYIGLRLILTSGTGTGQYGYIQNYDNVTKIATIYRESSNVAGWDHVIPGYPAAAILDTTTVYRIEPRVTFSPPSFSSTADTLASTATWTDITYADTRDTYTNVTATAGTGTTIEVPIAQATFNVTRFGSKYTLSLVNGGAGYTAGDQITILGTALGGTSPTNDVTIVVTSTTEDSTNSIVTFNHEGRGRGGNFVAIASGSNTVNWSVNGSDWNAATTPTTENWSALSSGSISSTTFVVAIATGGTRAASSINGGATWTNRTLPASAAWNDVAYGDSRFLAISTAGNTAVSTNGTTWTTSTSLPVLAGTNTWSSIVYGKGTWVVIAAGATSTQAAYSTDNGTTWNNATLPATASWRSISYGNNRFVAVAESSDQIAYSFDGITWISATLPASLSTPRIAYGQGLFLIAQPSSTTVYRSEDCQTWAIGSLTGSPSWSSVAFGNPNNDGRWVVIANGTDLTNIVEAGCRTKGRAVVATGVVNSIRIWEPGSGYLSAPTLTLTDPNNTGEINPLVRIGKGALAQPTFLNRGTAYRTSTTRVTVSGDGYADIVPVGKLLTIDGLLRYPRPGDNLTFNSDPTTIYRVVTIEELGGVDGYYKSKLRIDPELKEVDNITHTDEVTIRENFSQVRLTGHDFLDIGSGNFEQTNYPGNPLGVLAPENEVFQQNGGRVFYTSTDQNGNFRVGELFAVEQATGTVTISADFFNLSGLTEIALGGVRLGGTGAVIREFSTDALFTADSNNVVPTQRAIKAYLNSRLTTGGSEVSTASVVAGLVKIGPNEINTTTPIEIELPKTMNFAGNKANLSGLILAQTFFYRNIGS